MMIWFNVLLMTMLTAPCQGNLAQFYQMIRRLGAIEPTSLLSYGCFCGWGNSGREKVIDCLDMCCYHHDNCYTDLESAECRGTSYIFSGYSYNQDTMICDSTQDKCRLQLCKCDHDFGVCVRENKSWEKPECKNVKDTDICRPGENYTMPLCRGNNTETINEDTYGGTNQCKEIQRSSIDERTAPTEQTTLNNEIQSPQTTETSVTASPEPHLSYPNKSSILAVTYLDRALIACLLTILLAPPLLA